MSTATTSRPVVVDALDEATYHADPALSASGAKKLLPPSCPAIFQWEREHGQPPRAVFDFGKAAHAAVLGAGAPLVVVDADDWRSKAAREARDEAYAAGSTPLLTADKVAVDGMAAALRAHPIAAALLNPDRGKPEQSIFWRDTETGVDRRARLDWLPEPRPDGRLIVPDYKTCVSSEPRAIAKAVANFGYCLQDAWYRDAVRAAGLAEDPAFVFIFQMKTPPHVVTVVELDADAVRIGRALNDVAMRLFAECTASGVWPGFTDDVALVSLPPWATYQYEELTA